MGNDGGSIPTRGDLVRTKKRQRTDPAEKAERMRAKWSTCSLTRAPLQKHITADQLGNLFNKHDLLHALSEKSLPKRFKHIKSVKNLTDVHFQVNKFYDPNAKQQAGRDAEAFQCPYECPITQRPVNGSNAFSVLKTCGHAFSEKALIETETTNPVCYVCQTPFTVSDILPLNPDEETQHKLKENLKQKKKEKHQEEKLPQKEGTQETTSTNSTTSNSTTTSTTSTTSTSTMSTSTSTSTTSTSSTVEPDHKPHSGGKKRKPTDPEDGNARKKPKVAKPGSTGNNTTLGVKLALIQAEKMHEKNKQSSSVYRSIFSSTSNPSQPQKPASLTGIYFAKH